MESQDSKMRLKLGDVLCSLLSNLILDETTKRNNAETMLRKAVEDAQNLDIRAEMC